MVEFSGVEELMLEELDAGTEDSATILLQVMASITRLTACASTNGHASSRQNVGTLFRSSTPLTPIVRCLDGFHNCETNADGQD